jgi:branched-chain amino acid transport system ATP-binding protein
MVEPTEGLATLIVRELEDTLLKLKASGTSILLAEQRFNFALSVADRVYILAHGRTVAEGAPDDLWDNQQIKHTYLGV